MADANHKQRQLAAAVARLKRLETNECFDPAQPMSRPTEAQLTVLKDAATIEHRYSLGGNQCKPATSLIEMADGRRKSIALIQPGDQVLALDFEERVVVPTVVTAVHHNGVKPVYRYWTGPHTYFDSTENHQMVTYLGGKLTKRRADQLTVAVEGTYTFPGKRQYDDNRIELLGYLLGDGCLTKLEKGPKYRGLQFTNTNSEIVDKVRNLIGPGYHLRDCKQGDYFISSRDGTKGSNEYINWIRVLGLSGKKAHEKTIPAVVFESSLEERRGLVAGLIATDGHVDSGKGIISFFSTSKQLVLDLKRVLSGLGIYSTVSSRSRNNPKHRDEWRLKVSKKEHIIRFHSQITVPSKKCSIDALKANGISNSFATKKVIRSEYLGELPVYDITVAHHDHNYLADGFQVCGNSGKTQLGARETAWILTETHPYWKRPEAWGDEPLLLIVMGRTTKQIEETLWRKISSFLDPADYKVQRVGGVIQKVTHENGNTIIFLSHHSDTEAREKVQSFVAHYVWLDELPGSYKLIEELHRRIQARQGRFLATFTPKAINNEIRRLVDNAREPYAKKYKLKAFDNPTYSDEQKQSILASLMTASDNYRKTVLEGDWLTGEERVYYFDYDTMVEKPPNYQPTWRHLECVDPALSSALGLTVWAEDPVSKVWYCVLAEYVRGIFVPQDLVRTIKEKTAHFNIVRRRSDPHEVWYIQTAASMGIQYEGVYKKNERKGELIKTLQQSLGPRVKIAPWCVDLISELEECRWSETGEAKIVNASSYHLLDSAQYFTDNIPKPDSSPIGATFHGWLYQQNEERKKAAAAKQKQIEKKQNHRIQRGLRGKSVTRRIAGWTL